MLVRGGGGRPSILEEKKRTSNILIRGSEGEVRTCHVGGRGIRWIFSNNRKRGGDRLGCASFTVRKEKKPALNASIADGTEKRRHNKSC